MSGLRRVAQSVGLSALLLSAAATPAAAVDVSGDAVLYWNQVAAQNGFPLNPTAGSRAYAIFGAAVHDAANASLGSPNHGYSGITGSGGDTRAAVSKAARDVLVQFNPGAAATYNDALAQSLALIPDGAAKTNGIATGAAIASGILAIRATDGFNVPVPYTPTGLPGDWAPTAPGQVAVLPQWGQVDPWIINSGSQFRPGPPPDLTSLEYAAALNEVKAIGSLTSATRTADQTASAQFWAPPLGTGAWISAGLGIAEAQGLSTLENARLFGLLSLSVADAAIAVWDAKYAYDFWRPVTAIRMADLDGNDLTDVDATWAPLIGTPGHPSYISGHSGVAGAATTVLSAFLGDATPFCLSVPFTRCFSNFSSAGQDAINSRLWGGIHYRFDNAEGFTLGQRVGAFALASRTFDGVPEPSTWALMILGFGAAATALRRRRSALSA